MKRPRAVKHLLSPIQQMDGQQSDRSEADLPGPDDKGNLVPRRNYRQVKKQKELSGKARQLEKQQRRMARPNGSGEVVRPLQDPSVDPGDPTLHTGT